MIYMIYPLHWPDAPAGEAAKGQLYSSNRCGVSTYEFMNLCEGGKRNAKKR